MKIAVTYENGNVFQHFGHTENFKLYVAENGRVVSSCVISSDGQGHGALASLLADKQVNVLICGGIGGGARAALAAAGIEVFGGVHGNADEAVNAYLNGTLSFDPNARCAHHDAEHGEGEHTCGDHGCGKHDCH